MLLINSLTNNAMQQFSLTGIPGIEINVVLRFMPRVQIWNMDISYGDFIAQGIPVVCSPNLLRQWRSIIPFGIGCTNVYKLDPYTINDFADASSNLLLLNSADVAAVEAALYP
jgi:hypothetical protein